MLQKEIARVTTTSSYAITLIAVPSMLSNGNLNLTILINRCSHQWQIKNHTRHDWYLIGTKTTTKCDNHVHVGINSDSTPKQHTLNITIPSKYVFPRRI